MTGHSFLVSHSGKQHAYQHALSMHRLGRLERLVTSSYYKPSCWIDRGLAGLPKLGRMLAKRHLDGLPDELVMRRPLFEVPELFWRDVVGDRGRAEEAMYRRDAAFDRWVARRIDEGGGFWGFQGSCLASLAVAKAAGRLAVCEFATAHVTAAVRILTAEAEAHPDWAGTISNVRFPDWYRERLEREPMAADRCIAASSFTRASLLEVGVAEDCIDVLPLGVDVDQFEFCPRRIDGPLKVLFVGGIGQRKGIKYLLDAIALVDSAAVTLSLLGPLPVDETPLQAVSDRFEYLGRTDQPGVVRQMHAHDVLVLPSVFEGFGLVIVEAMATGMPVIASTHSCGPEVIREGVDGFVLAPDDVDGLAQKIDWMAANRSAAVEMGRAAAGRAAEFSWRRHRDRLAEILWRWDSAGGGEEPC